MLRTRFNSPKQKVIQGSTQSQIANCASQGRLPKTITKHLSQETRSTSNIFLGASIRAHFSWQRISRQRLKCDRTERRDHDFPSILRHLSRHLALYISLSESSNGLGALSSLFPRDTQACVRFELKRKEVCLPASLTSSILRWRCLLLGVPLSLEAVSLKHCHP